ncbi:hypothetical protein [Halalkalicoccus salilacus]
MSDNENEDEDKRVQRGYRVGERLETNRTTLTAIASSTLVIRSPPLNIT